MSDYIVHFTKPVAVDAIPRPKPKNPDKPTIPERLAELRYEQRTADRSGYFPWIDILSEGQLQAGPGPLGAARKIAPVADLHRVVCFSEIPLDMLDRLIKRRSLYGIGFRKDVMIAKGAGPVWYLDKDGIQAQLVQDEIAAAMAGGIDRDDPIWRLTPLIDNPGTYGTVLRRFEWEREWRVIDDIAFAPEDVAFLFLPEEDHEKAQGFFVEVEREHTGPSYLCPYIDPRWEMDRIQDALAKVHRGTG